MNTAEASESPVKPVAAPSSEPKPINYKLYSTLFAHELAWRDEQQFLESRGYMLRPRLRPGWVPSWTVSGDKPWDCEDSYSLHFVPHIVDALRMSDGKLVSIKIVRTGSLETQIAVYLCSPPLNKDDANHCVPVLDLFEDDEYVARSYMVMPLLRRFNNSNFDCINDILDVGEQYLEGLAFLHRNGIAHRDCSYANLMMDANPLYSHGFQPIRSGFRPDGKTVAWPRSRTACPVKYYYIDFGISVYIPPNVEPKLAIGGDGRDQDPPELSDEVPYDPFKLDVFILGNFFRQKIYDKYSNIQFLQPILQAMTQASPDDRPSAADALEQWRRMRKTVLRVRRYWRLKRQGEELQMKIILHIVHIGMTVYCLVKRSKTTKKCLIGEAA